MADLSAVRRFALHEVELSPEGALILHSLRLIDATDSGRRAEHLATEFARCNPGKVYMIVNRATVATDRQRLFRRTGEGPEMRVEADYA